MGEGYGREEEGLVHGVLMGLKADVPSEIYGLEMYQILGGLLGYRGSSTSNAAIKETDGFFSAMYIGLGSRFILSRCPAACE